MAVRAATARAMTGISNRPAASVGLGVTWSYFATTKSRSLSL